MVAIRLDAEKEQQLSSLARAQGKDAPELARCIIEDYLEFLTLGEYAAADWAEASTALAPEVMQDDHWKDDDE